MVSDVEVKEDVSSITSKRDIKSSKNSLNTLNLSYNRHSSSNLHYLLILSEISFFLNQR